MSYFPSISIKEYQDSPSLDAFGRLKTSNPFTQFDFKQINGNQLEGVFFVTQSINSATSSYTEGRASTTLSVAAASGSRFIRQTRARMDYQPGKGLSLYNTFVFGTGSNGIVKRVGYFDESNGIFFEQSGSDLNMVVRSTTGASTVENRISQSNWSINKFDNTTTHPMDITKVQILGFDFQWLGAGRVRTGFFISGSYKVAHEFDHENIVTGVYMSTPNLPVRAEIENYTGVSANSMEIICNSVQSDGGYEPSPAGVQRSVDRTTTTKSVTTGSLKPLLTIKLASGSQGRTVTPVNFSIFATTNDTFRWIVYLNPVYSGSDSPVWSSVSGSAVLYDIARDGSITGGTILDSGYGTGGQSRIATASTLSNLRLGFTVEGASDEITIAAQPLTTAAFLAQIGWYEI